MKECRFKKTCKEECEHTNAFAQCEVYKKFESEIRKERIVYGGIDK